MQNNQVLEKLRQRITELQDSIDTAEMVRDSQLVQMYTQQLAIVQADLLFRELGVFGEKH